MARVKKSKNKNFFVKFWNGELSLPMSYWGVGVGIGILYGGLAGIFTVIAGLSDDAVVGIWRSSNNYKGPKFWAVLAKILIVLGVISNFGQILAGA